MASNPFEQAYLDYVRAIKAAWAEVDVDAVMDSMRDDDGNIMQGCGEAFSTLGSAASLGTLACAGGTFGTLGTLGTAGTLAPSVAEEDSASADQRYDERTQS
jgi:hypothetical protein